jgi:hypothetical protein
MAKLRAPKPSSLKKSSYHRFWSAARIAALDFSFCVLLDLKNITSKRRFSPHSKNR